MAFPKHPIIDVTPVDAARGSAATAQAAAEPFMPPSFGKRVGKMDNQPLHAIGAGAAIAAGGIKKIRNGK